MTDLRPAVFLDRDGTINEQMGYINHISRFKMMPGAAAAVGKLNDAGIPAIVVTNQSGVARGYYPEELVELVHEKMKAELDEEGAFVDRIYYCPHHTSAENPAYRVACDCRKPKTGMYRKAAVELNIDLPGSFYIGDRYSDLKPGDELGGRTILVLTGYGRGELEHVLPGKNIRPDYIAEDLMEAVDWILKQIG